MLLNNAHYTPCALRLRKEEEPVHAEAQESATRGRTRLHGRFTRACFTACCKFTCAFAYPAHDRHGPSHQICQLSSEHGHCVTRTERNCRCSRLVRAARAEKELGRTTEGIRAQRSARISGFGGTRAGGPSASESREGNRSPCRTEATQLGAAPRSHEDSPVPQPMAHLCGVLFNAGGNEGRPRGAEHRPGRAYPASTGTSVSGRRLTFPD